MNINEMRRTLENYDKHYSLVEKLDYNELEKLYHNNAELEHLMFQFNEESVMDRINDFMCRLDRVSGYIGDRGEHILVEHMPDFYDSLSKVYDDVLTDEEFHQVTELYNEWCKLNNAQNPNYVEMDALCDEAGDILYDSLKTIYNDIFCLDVIVGETLMAIECDYLPDNMKLAICNAIAEQQDS